METKRDFKTTFKEEPYLIINAIFAVIIIGIMLYSLVFSPDENNYPVACVHELLTGEPCASCGISHSFSLILRGRTDEAELWNPNGMRVFLFFALQLFMRVFSSVVFILGPSRKKLVVGTDIAISSVYLLWAFWPFLLFIF